MSVDWDGNDPLFFIDFPIFFKILIKIYLLQRTNGIIQTTILNKIKSEFKDSPRVEVTNMSHKHNVPKGKWNENQFTSVDSQIVHILFIVKKKRRWNSFWNSSGQWQVQ